MNPTYFETPAQFRAWLEANHATASELSVGFRKKGTGLPSITWPESVDQALCFGWIDGVRHSIDAENYRIRFTPRKPGGIWSQVNIGRFTELLAQGLVHPRGVLAYETGKGRTNQYSHERGEQSFSEAETERFEANARALLSAERTALNLLGRLSGVATLTHTYTTAISGTKARIADTRKTTPGLRHLEKYAVRCGGGLNHRFGLDDAILIKDNHVAACGGVAEALKRARAAAGHLMKIEVEVDSLAQFDEALPLAPDVIMLDNFSLEDLATAVRLAAGKVTLEASGGVNLKTVRGIAETGVDVISVGALTHSAPVLDIGLDAV